MSPFRALVATRWDELRATAPPYDRWVAALAILPLFVVLAAFGRWATLAAVPGALLALFTVPVPGSRWHHRVAWPHLPIDPRLRSASELLLAGLPVGAVALLGALVVAAITGEPVLGVALLAGAGAAATGPWLGAPGPRRERLPPFLLVGVGAAAGGGCVPAGGWVTGAGLLTIAGLGIAGVRRPVAALRAGEVRSGPVSFGPARGMFHLIVWPALRAGALVLVGAALAFPVTGSVVGWVTGHPPRPVWPDAPMFLVVMAMTQPAGWVARVVVGKKGERAPFDWLPVPSGQPVRVAMWTCMGLGLLFGATNLALLPAPAEVYIGHGSDPALAALTAAGVPEPLRLLQETYWHDPRVAAGLLLCAAVIGSGTAFGSPQRTLALFLLLLGGIAVDRWELRATQTLISERDLSVAAVTGDPWQVWARDIASRPEEVRAERADSRDRRALAAGGLALLSLLVVFVPRRGRP